MNKSLLTLFTLITACLFTACGGDKKAETEIAETDAPTQESVKTSTTQDTNLALKMATEAGDLTSQEITEMVAALEQVAKNPQLTAEKKAQIENQIKVLQAQLKTLSDSVK